MRQKIQSLCRELSSNLATKKGYCTQRLRLYAENAIACTTATMMKCARDHSEAPDKDCPTWLIRDYEAGAYFVRQCMGCWNKTEPDKSEVDKMVDERMRDELIKYDRWMSGNYWGVKQIPTPEQSVDEYLKSRER